MKKILAIVIVLAALFLMVLTCPKKPAHVEAMKEAVTEYIDSNVLSSQTDNTQKGVAFLVSLFAPKLVGTFLESQLEVDDYFVLSVGHISFDGEDHVVSLGVLNHVFTFDKNDLADAVDQSE